MTTVDELWDLEALTRALYPSKGGLSLEMAGTLKERLLLTVVGSLIGRDVSGQG